MMIDTCMDSTLDMWYQKLKNQETTEFREINKDQSKEKNRRERERKKGRKRETEGCTKCFYLSYCVSVCFIRTTRFQYVAGMLGEFGQLGLKKIWNHLLP